MTYHLLSVMSNNATYGIAAGSGQFPDGSQVAIAAIPMQDYHFVSWSDGSTNNPHTISLDEDLLELQHKPNRRPREKFGFELPYRILYLSLHS